MIAVVAFIAGLYLGCLLMAMMFVAKHRDRPSEN